MVFTSTTTALDLPLLSTPSLYQAATTEFPSFTYRVPCFIYLHLKFRFCEVLYPFDLLVDLHLRCLFLEVHLLTSLCHTSMLAQRVTRRTCYAVACGLRSLPYWACRAAYSSCSTGLRGLLFCFVKIAASPGYSWKSATRWFWRSPGYSAVYLPEARCSCPRGPRLSYLVGRLTPRSSTSSPLVPRTRRASPSHADHRGHCASALRGRA